MNLVLTIYLPTAEETEAASEVIRCLYTDSLMKHTFSFVLKSLIITVECLAWLLVMYFAPAPKHMIQLSARFENSDLTMKILSRGHPQFTP